MLSAQFGTADLLGALGTGCFQTQTCNFKLFFHSAEHPVFRTLHFFARGGFEVVIAGEVEQSVDDVAGQLGLPGGAELAGLGDGVVEADEDFAVQGVVRGAWGVRGVVEGDDVGGAFVLEEGFVETGHFPRGDEVDAEFALCGVKMFREQMARDLPEQGQVHGARALAVADLEEAGHFV